MPEDFGVEVALGDELGCVLEEEEVLLVDLVYFLLEQLLSHLLRLVAGDILEEKLVGNCLKSSLLAFAHGNL